MSKRGAFEEPEQGNNRESVSETPDDLGAWMAGLSHQDELTVERLSPLTDRGWLGAFVWDQGLDIHSQIRESYGGGTYLIKARRRAKSGALNWIKGSFRVEIAGAPRQPTPPRENWNGSSNYMPSTPAPTNAGIAAELQTRLLDILSDKMGESKSDVVPLVGQILEIVNGRGVGHQPIDPIQSILATAEAGKRLADIYAPPAAQVVEKEPESMMERMMMMMMMKMMGGEKTTPASHPVMPPPPPGWGWNGQQWVRVAAPNPPPPPPPTPAPPPPSSSPRMDEGEAGDEEEDKEEEPMSPEELADEVGALSPEELKRFLARALPDFDLEKMTNEFKMP